jgi:hypothetical protein
MNLPEQRDIIQAAIDGKALQMRVLNQGRPWQDREPTHFNFGHYEYRLKPVPREWWVNVYASLPNGGYLYETRQLADSNAVSNRSGCIKVREVAD